MRDHSANEPPFETRARRSRGDGHVRVVQFPQDESLLSVAAPDLLATGSTAAEPLVVLSTARHGSSLERAMAARRVGVPLALGRGHGIWLDAAETLSTFMVDGLPDEERFRRSLGRVLESADGRRRPHSRAVRAYGDLANLLGEPGNTARALRVEELWSELARSHSFTPLFAYALANIYEEAHGALFQEIFRRPSRVIPTVEHTQTTEDARTLRIARLEQRALVLEAEVEQRKQLEQRLRDALYDRLRVEAALRESTSALRSSLADRDELVERERRLRVAAEQANRAKSDFLAVMSHELRTPLNAIAGHIQLVELGVHGTVTDAQGDALRRAQRSQRHLLSLINALLNLARTESGRVAYRLERLDPVPLLSELAGMVEPLARAKRIRLDLLPSEGPRADARMRADAEKVQQILLNVLTNAIKFTPEAGRITIGVRRVESTDRIAIVVHDSGIGIPPDKLEAIFQPFVQLAMDPAGQREGFGLGLAISRDLARGMGGDLEATSTPGDGAAFTLTLPGE